MKHWAIERQKIETLVLEAWEKKTPKASETARKAICEFERRYPDRTDLIAFAKALSEHIDAHQNRRSDFAPKRKSHRGSV